MEQMVEIIDKNYTDMFNRFGNKWLWSKDSNGNPIDWKTIDVDKNYGVVNNYLRYNLMAN